MNPLQQVVNSQELIEFHEGENGKLVKFQDKNTINPINFQQNLRNLMSFFLPKGYPSSIEKGYLQYSGYQFSGYLFSTAGSVLSTQSLLYALGLGDGSIPLAVTLNWIIKDGLGQFGGVLFASFVNNQFDQNPKRWRIISSVALDLSSFLELLTPLAPKYFLFLASLANIGKNISYLSASASRVAIHKSFTRHENLADVTAKTGSQTILSSLLGTSLGIYISTLVNHSYPLTSAAFLLCSAMHLSCTYLSLQSVTIRTLTHSKLQEIFGSYLANLSRTPPSPGAGVPIIMTPQQFSSTEPILFPTAPSQNSSTFAHRNQSPIIIGADLSEIFPSLSDFRRAQDLFSSFPYLVIISSSPPLSHHRIYVTLYDHTTDQDALHAILLAQLAQHLLLSSVPLQSSLSTASALQWDAIAYTLEAFKANQYRTDEFLSQLQALWIVDLFLLESRKARVKTILPVDPAPAAA